MKLSHLMIAMLAVASAGTAMAAADTYNLDPTHTFPSFEADHMGMSVWRGKFNKTKGTVTLDRAAKSGTLDLVIEADSIDFGLDAMNTHAKKADMFNVEKFPQITYKSNKLHLHRRPIDASRWRTDPAGRDQAGDTEGGQVQVHHAPALQA